MPGMLNLSEETNRPQHRSHSDARSGQVVDDRIRPALESGSAVGSSKPVLLVIDEIDGATGAGENVSHFRCRAACTHTLVVQ